MLSAFFSTTFGWFAVIFPTTFEHSSAFFGTTFPICYVFTGYENVARWKIKNSSIVPLDTVRGISFPPCNYLTDRGSAKSSKSFWPFFAISSKCWYCWLPKIAERCMVGPLKNREKVYAPLPFFWLRALWLNFFSDSKNRLIFVSEDISRPWKTSYFTIPNVIK